MITGRGESSRPLVGARKRQRERRFPTFFLGDFIYVDWRSTQGWLDNLDDPAFSYAEHETLLDRLYQDALAEPHFKGFAAQRNITFMWDDHELKNDYDEKDTWPRFALARSKFKQYLRSTEPVSARLFTNGSVRHPSTGERTFVYFLLDGRSYRDAFLKSDDFAQEEDQDQRRLQGPESSCFSASSGHPPQSKTMLGSDQIAAVKQWLLDQKAEDERQEASHGRGSAAWKLLISSTMWNDQGAQARYRGKRILDGWAGYARERNALLDWIREQEVRNVFLLSADAHWSGVFSFPKHSDLYELSASPLAAPALPKPSANATATSAGLTSSEPQFMVDARDNIFGLLTVTSSNRLEARLVSAKGLQDDWEELYRLELDAA